MSPQEIAKDELNSEDWLRLLAQIGHRSYKELRIAIPAFLEIDVFSVSIENCVSFLDAMIESWDIDLKTFAMKVVLNPQLAPQSLKRFEFAEREIQTPLALEPGLEHFLRDKTLSGDVTAEEIEFLKALRFKGKQPSPIYYYRELQSLRIASFPNGRRAQSTNAVKSNSAA